MPASQPVVVDANILISLLIAKGSKQELFVSEHIRPYSPELVLFEIGKYWKRISEQSGLPDEELKSAFDDVKAHLTILSLTEIREHLSEAEIISPDKEDTEYFASALKLGCPIWSEDKLLKKQSRVDVLLTRELLSKLGLTQ